MAIGQVVRVGPRKHRREVRGTDYELAAESNAAVRRNGSKTAIHVNQRIVCVIPPVIPRHEQLHTVRLHGEDRHPLIVGGCVGIHAQRRCPVGAPVRRAGEENIRFFVHLGGPIGTSQIQGAELVRSGIHHWYRKRPNSERVRVRRRIAPFQFQVAAE